MIKDPKLTLEQILESIKIVEMYLEDVDKKEFMSSVGTQDKVVRRIEIIGEAVKRLPDEIRKENSDIPWKRIAGTRDNVIHEYDEVDLDSIWDAYELEFSKLKTRIKEIKEGLE